MNSNTNRHGWIGSLLVFCEQSKGIIEKFQCCENCDDDDGDDEADGNFLCK